MSATALLTKSDLNLPLDTRLDDLRVEEFEDLEGKPALRITAILPRGTTPGELKWERVRPIYDEVVRLLSERDAQHRFPYFRVITREDVEEAGLGSAG